MKKEKNGNFKHGLWNTKFYRTWYNMNARCNKKNNPRYNKYGGKGVIVEWKTFNDFIKDMYNDYKEHIKLYGENNTSIDRINNNGNYSKENCRWATNKQQMLNTGRNRILKFNGKSQTLKEWSEDLGINENTLRVRLHRGYDIDKILKPII